MPRAKLRLTIPEGVWIGDLSRTYPATLFRILAALPDEDVGVGLTEVVSTELPPVLSDLGAADEIATFDILHHHDDTALVQFETTMPLLLFPARESGVPIEMPFEIRNGEATWEVTAPRDRLSALGNQLDAFGIRFAVEHVHQHVDSEQLLTGRQLTLLETAVEEGYYDTPRTCTLTELAASVEIAKSTCSETLHRAEEKVVKQFVGEDDVEAMAVSG